MKKKRYKLDNEYRKSNTKTIPIVVSEEFLSDILIVEKDLLKEKYSRSLILRESIKLGLPLLIEKLKKAGEIEDTTFLS